MKILLVNDAATTGGGAEVLTIAIRDELRGRGHDARLFASTAAYGPGPMHADYSCYGTLSMLRTVNRVANVAANIRLRAALDEFDPDVVHVRMFLTQLSPLILPLLRDVPTVYHATWYETICPTGLKVLPSGSACCEPAGWACRRNRCVSRRAWPLLMTQLVLYRHWRHVFDRIIVNSEAGAAMLRSYGVHPVEVIENGVPLQPPRPPLTSPPTIGFAGRLSREKGVDVLLRAFADVRNVLPDARLLIAGDGGERAAIEHLIAELDLGSRVSMLGHLHQAELERCLGPAWVHAVPSRPPETFGLTAAEAMMRGTAVVASDVGGLPAVVEHQRTGLLVPSADVPALAHALMRLLQDRALAEEMGQAGRQRAVASFSQSTFVDRLITVYSSLLGCAA
jgi:glycosyltransferase involved in cell wall biosynthesis